MSRSMIEFTGVQTCWQKYLEPCQRWVKELNHSAEFTLKISNACEDISVFHFIITYSYACLYAPKSEHPWLISALSQRRIIIYRTGPLNLISQFLCTNTSISMLHLYCWDDCWVFSQNLNTMRFLTNNHQQCRSKSSLSKDECYRYGTLWSLCCKAAIETGKDNTYIISVPKVWDNK